VAELLGISVHTVADHMKSIYRKLHVSGRAEASLEGVRRGLIDLK
jgi:DNA-binding CsgD family transcriptional regulator